MGAQAVRSFHTRSARLGFARSITARRKRDPQREAARLALLAVGFEALGRLWRRGSNEPGPVAGNQVEDASGAAGGTCLAGSDACANLGPADNPIGGGAPGLCEQDSDCPGSRCIVEPGDTTGVCEQ